MNIENKFLGERGGCLGSSVMLTMFVTFLIGLIAWQKHSGYEICRGFQPGPEKAKVVPKREKLEKKETLTLRLCQRFQKFSLWLLVFRP